MHYRARLLALLLAAACAVAADVPTDAEWAPLAEVIASGAPEAAAQLDEFTKRFPKWPDGFRALALAQLRNNEGKAAWAAARQALGLNAKDAAAGALGVQALTALGRYPDALNVADRFSEATDPEGQVAAMAAVAALAGRDEEALAKHLAAAKSPHPGGDAGP